jgi:hypothetical protein
MDSPNHFYHGQRVCTTSGNLFCGCFYHACTSTTVHRTAFVPPHDGKTGHCFCPGTGIRAFIHIRSAFSSLYAPRSYSLFSRFYPRIPKRNSTPQSGSFHARRRNPPCHDAYIGEETTDCYHLLCPRRTHSLSHSAGWIRRFSALFQGFGIQNRLSSRLG